MSKQFLFSLLLFIIAPAYAIQFPYEVPGALIDETASNLQGPFEDWKIWCHPVIMSNEPDDNQDEAKRIKESLKYGSIAKTSRSGEEWDGTPMSMVGGQILSGQWRINSQL
ncbi:MAG: hypothetical protein AB8A35_02955 [Prochlorococcus sp.]